MPPRANSVKNDDPAVLTEVEAPVASPLAMDPVPTAISYTLRRSRRRRRTMQLSLGPEGGLIVAAPMRTSHREVEAFVQQKARWVRRALREAREREEFLRRDFITGESIPYLGQALQLCLVDAGVGQRTVERHGARLEVRLPAAVTEGRRRAVIIESLAAWYKADAQAVFPERVRHFAPRIGVEPKGLRVRDQKTRWGSCGKDGTLYLSWRLVMAPLPIVDYLVVHELCHLRRKGHGPAFWALVARVLPDYQERRAELRRDGWRYRLS